VICLTGNRDLAVEICKGKVYAKEYGGMGQPGDEGDVKEFQLVESSEEFERLAFSANA